MAKLNKRSKDLGQDDLGSMFDSVHSRIDDAVKGISNLTRSLKNPTNPVYDSTNFPDNPGRGQIVRDINDPSALWIYGEDDQWHKVGGIEFCLAEGDTVGTGFDTGLPGPIKWNHFDTNATEVFDLDTNPQYINFRKNGFYLVFYGAKLDFVELTSLSSYGFFASGQIGSQIVFIAGEHDLTATGWINLRGIPEINFPRQFWIQSNIAHIANQSFAAIIHLETLLNLIPQT